MAKRTPQPRHEWRESARELAIVVIGVLLALLAQQVVQDLEWRHKVAGAESSMKHELLWDDGPQIYQRAIMHPCLTRRLDEIRAAVEGHAPRERIVALTDSYAVRQLTYDVVAQQAALASDVSSHIPRDQLEPYMLPYAIMPDIGRSAADEQQHLALLHALSRTGGPLSEAESMQALNAVELLRNDTRFMFNGSRWSLRQLKKLGPLDSTRLNDMIGFARQHYGACVKPLPADFPDSVAED